VRPFLFVPSPSPTPLSYKRTGLTRAFHLNAQKTYLLIDLHYVDKICVPEPTVTLSSLTVHRSIISIVSSNLKSRDAFCTNPHCACVVGLAQAKLACLERAFLGSIDWRLSCTGRVLQLYYVDLVAHSGGRFYIPPTPPTPPLLYRRCSYHNHPFYYYYCACGQPQSFVFYYV
jgi:hypothetical protein